MNYDGIEQFIKKNIRFGQHWNKKVITMSDAKWQELKEDTFLNGKSYAKGSRFKVFETTNFGWIVFETGTKDCHGHEATVRILKY